MFMRLVHAQFKPDTVPLIRRVYEEQIIPRLQSTSGCLFAGLIKSESKNEGMSMTLWDSKEHAESYEKSGVFSQLTNKVKHAFSTLYQWKIALEKTGRRKVVTSEDLSVGHYDIVVGRGFSD